MFIDRDTDIDGSPAPAGAFTLTAVIGQYDASSPYLDGHQLIPRSLADFTYAGNQPPSISAMTRLPYVPDNTEAVTVTALVVDDVSLASVVLNYQVNGGGVVTLPMSVVSGDIWGATIPAQADGAMVDYYVEATDNEAETSTSATFSYTVYAVFPCADIATIRANDGNGVPLLQGTTQYICGVLTVGSEFGSGGPFYLTHATGSVALFGGELYSSTAIIGDEIQAVGTVGFYNGLTEMENIAGVVVLGHVGEPVPVATTIAALSADPESFEAQFVQLLNCTLVDPLQWPAPGSHANVTIAQGADQFVMRIDRDTNIDENPAPGGPFHVVGVIGQFDGTAPYFEGYQMTPRRWADITLAPQELDAPVVSAAYGGGLVNLSWAPVEGATDYIVFSSTSTGYDGWNAGVPTGGATFLSVPATGRAFYKVVAVN
jgi:hypothetical protein